MTEQPSRIHKADNDKSKAYQYKHKKRQLFEIGQKGFLATCNFRERDCVRECYNILSQYANELYGPEAKDNNTQATEEETAETDISDDLQKEIDAAKASAAPGRLRRFQAVDTTTKNCIFIKTTLDDPVELGTHLIKDIAEKKLQKTRYLLRLTPIEVVCKATVDEITKAGGALFDKYFLKEGKTFSIVFNKRYNTDLKRDEVIKSLADLVQGKNIKNKVDLKNAELSVIVEVIKGKCCLSVVEGYTKYRKYNLVELASTRSDNGAKKEDNGAQKEDDGSKKEDNGAQKEDNGAKKEDNGNDKNKENVVTEDEPVNKKMKESDDPPMPEEETHADTCK